MRWPRGTIVAIVLILTSSVAFAQETARSLYDQGKYQEALDALQKTGLQSASDFYNAGNCLYRLGKVGQALSYYEKASALAPRNEDIRYNLHLAEETLNKTGSLPKDQSFWTGRMLPLARHIPEEYADLLIALTTLGLAVAAYRLKSAAKKTGLRLVQAFLDPGFLAALGLWAFSCAGATLTIMAHHLRVAAVVADQGVARSGPSETFTELFKLPAGTMVELTGQSRDGWQQIRFSLGNMGWIVEKDLLSL